MKILTLDELIMLHDKVKDEKAKLQRIFFLMWCCIVPYLVLAFVHPYGPVHMVVICGLLICNMYMFYGVYKIGVYGIHQEKLYKNIEFYTERIPYTLIKRSRDYWGGSWVDYSISAIECYECHIPGDCLLCGAE